MTLCSSNLYFWKNAFHLQKKKNRRNLSLQAVCHIPISRINGVCPYQGHWLVGDSPRNYIVAGTFVNRAMLSGRKNRKLIYRSKSRNILLTNTDESIQERWLPSSCGRRCAYSCFCSLGQFSCSLAAQKNDIASAMICFWRHRCVTIWSNVQAPPLPRSPIVEVGLLSPTPLQLT